MHTKLLKYSGCFWRALTTGAILMASGRVPKMERILIGVLFLVILVFLMIRLAIAFRPAEFPKR